MDLVLKVLILLGNLEALVAVPIVSSTRDVNEAVSGTVGDYNGATAGKYLYRLFQTEGQEVDSAAGSVGVNFIIKETICLKSRHDDHQNCFFKPGGVTVNCAAHVVTAGNIRKISGHCHSQNDKHLFRRDLMAAIQGDTGPSGDTEKLHKQECLECIFTLLPATEM